MKATVSALDTLTFGVGKPSVWGEDTFGAGMFPPYPSVVRGAVRTSALCETGSFDKANTEDDTTKDYAVTEYALLLNGIPHYPAPADFVWSKNAEALILTELRENDGLSSLTADYQLWADTDDLVESSEKRYISLESLQKYLNGERGIESVSLNDYITPESRIGIYRERGARTVKKGMLYRSPLIRPRGGKTSEGGHYDAAVAANISGANAGGLIRFGGENKAALFAPYGGGISPKGAIGDSGEFKLYLATPAMFNGGHLPQLSVGATLLTAAVCGYDSIGGFDMKAKRPKPMRRAVKAGSVYYYKLDENTERGRAAVLALHGMSISDYSREDGFGLCFVGQI